MPAALLHPGVYIEEIPSGVRAITGVATSITAFIGRARLGPTDEVKVVNGFADFERTFGGLWLESQLGYAVRDFFLNGGGQALVVRLYKPPAGPPAATPEFSVGGIGLGLRARANGEGISASRSTPMA